MNKLYYKINNFLTLRLEYGQTNIYVKGQLFNQCKYLLINIAHKDIKKYDTINSIDEAVETYKTLGGTEGNGYYITPEAEFWGHCSNIQAWYEHDYDSRLLHSNLSFPLLKRLYEVGDPLAKRVFKEEIAKRISSGSLVAIEYLKSQKYLTLLSIEEISTILEQPEFKTALRENFRAYGLISNFTSLRTIIKLYRICKLYNQAISILKGLLLIDPSIIFLWEELAICYLKTKQFNLTRRVCQKALRLNKESERALFILGVLFNKRKFYSKALFYLKKAIDLGEKKGFQGTYKEDHQVTKGYYGFVLTNAGRYQEALKIYYSLLKDNKNNVITWNNAAWTFNHLQQYDKALIAAKKGLSIDGTFVNLWNHFGFALYNTGRKTAGIKFIRKAVDKNPKYTNGWYNLTKVLFAEGNYEEAYSCFLKIKEIDPLFERDKAKLQDLVAFLTNVNRPTNSLLPTNFNIEALINNASI